MRVRQLLPLCLAPLLLTACLDRELKPLNPCLVSGVVSKVQVTRIDKVDMLFVVDNSGSMKEEQEALARELPRLIEVMTTGDQDGDGVPDFPPATDLHLGVVSTDLGVPRIHGIDGCDGLGDDGVLLHSPPPDRPECAGNHPAFISYRADLSDPATTALDFSCVSTLGTEGCGFEQQLEAGLKALWPSVDRDPITNEVREPNRITFLDDENGFGSLGRGDQENAGFLRTDPSDPSVLAVILVTDEEDCSSHDPIHFAPDTLLDPNDPIASQDLNLRCFFNGDNLYPITRYVNGLRELRPGLEDLLVFGAIVGVPENLVDADARANVNFSDEQSRNAYYDSLLNDPRMQEAIDPNRPAGEGNLLPSCSSENGTAFPPRRIVETAKALGEGAVVQSICQDDFGPAVDAIIDIIKERLSGLCLPKQLVRDASGEVGCEVLWELPPPATAPVDTPTSCAAMPFLEPMDPPRVAEDGGEVCRIAQVPVVGQQPAPTAERPEGWFYDNFSPAVVDNCPSGQQQQIAFTTAATPPKKVVVKLECLDERPTLGESGNDLPREPDAPTIGSPCDRIERGTQVLEGDAACEVRLRGAASDASDGVDRSLFCHPQLNVCMQPCSTDTDCPAAWICDDRGETIAATQSDGRPEGTAVCLNPTCGDDE